MERSTSTCQVAVVYVRATFTLYYFSCLCEVMEVAPAAKWFVPMKNSNHVKSFSNIT